MNTRLVRTSLLACVLLAALLLSTPRQTHAASCTSQGSGNWSTISWSCGHVPGTGANVGDDVTINSSVHLDTNVSIGSFTVSDPNEFGINSGISMTVVGNWTHNSNSAFGGGVPSSTVTFAGTSPQTIGNVTGVASQTFYDLVISNPTNVSLTGGSTTVYVKGQLTINAGMFAQGATPLILNGNLVNDGIFDGGSASVTFQGTTVISGSGATTFHDVGGGSSLTLPSGNLHITGDWRSPTTLNANNGTVVMSGTSIQSILPSSATFYNLTIPNGATLAVGASTTVTILNGGTLTVNGALRLPSTGFVQSDTSGVSTLMMGANGTIQLCENLAYIRAQGGGVSTHPVSTHTARLKKASVVDRTTSSTETTTISSSVTPRGHSGRGHSLPIERSMAT